MNEARHPNPAVTLVLGMILSFHQGLRLNFRPRKVLVATTVMLLLISVQVAMVLADRRNHTATDMYLVFTSLMVLNLILPFLSLITALGLLGGEIEQGTLVYLLIRPCPRLSILLGRTLAAAAVTLGVLVILFITCLATVHVIGRIGSGLRPPLPSLDLAMHLTAIGGLGALVFTSLYSALTLFCKRPLVALMLGLTHALIWEGVVAFLPGTIGGYTFTQNLRSLFFEHSAVGPWPRLVLFRDSQLVPHADDAVVFLAGCTMVFLLLGWFKFRGREIRPAD